MKEKNTKKNMFIVLIITVIFGAVAFFIAKQVDQNVARVTELRGDIDEMKRVASSKEDKIEQLQSVDEYNEFYENVLPKTEEMIAILQQIEIMGNLTNNNVTIQLEEGVITPETIEFKDVQEKTEFIKSLDVKEYNPEGEGETEEGDSEAAAAPGANVAMQFGSEESTETGEVKFQYLEINLNVRGSYEDIRRFISLLQSSEYIMNIQEIRMVKTKADKLDAGITIRAFIFE